MEFISNKYLKVVAIGNRFFEYMITEKNKPRAILKVVFSSLFILSIIKAANMVINNK